MVSKTIPRKDKGKGIAIEEVATEVAQEEIAPQNQLPLAKDLLAAFLQQQVTNEHLLQRSEDILDAIIGLNRNLVKLNSLTQRSLNSIACLIAGREPDPLLFQFLPEEIRHHYDRVWDQYTAYHAQMEADLASWRERQAAKDAAKDAKATEEGPKAETEERKDDVAASTSQTHELQTEAPIVATPLQQVEPAVATSEQIAEAVIEAPIVDLTEPIVVDEDVAE